MVKGCEEKPDLQSFPITADVMWYPRSVCLNKQNEIQKSSSSSIGILKIKVNAKLYTLYRAASTGPDSRAPTATQCVQGILITEEKGRTP